MFESRSFGEPEEPIVDYEYEDRDTGEVYTSPFPVVVFTIEEEPLGVGRAIGQVGFGDRAIPILEIDDKTAPLGKVHILGSECWWHPVIEELTDNITPEGLESVVSAYEYARRLDIGHQASQN